MRFPFQEGIELFLQRRRVGHEPWLCRDAQNVDLVGFPVCTCKRAEKVFRVEQAENVFLLVAPERNACMRARQCLRDDFGIGKGGVDHRDILAMNHDVAHIKVMEVENTAQHVAVDLDHAAFLMMQRNRAAQFFMGRKYLPTGARAQAKDAGDHFTQRAGAGCGHQADSLSRRRVRKTSRSTSRVMKASPMPRARMKVSLPSTTFLSCPISAISPSASGSDPLMSESREGRPALARWLRTRTAS